jgi:hypothetical protein
VPIAIVNEKPDYGTLASGSLVEVAKAPWVYRRGAIPFTANSSDVSEQVLNSKKKVRIL